MRAWLRVGLLVAALGSAGGVSAQDALTRRDGQGAVTVVVTLAGLPQVGVPIRATVVLDTHTVALDDVVFERAVALRMPEGAEVAPTRVEGFEGRRPSPRGGRGVSAGHRSGGRCAWS